MKLMFASDIHGSAYYCKKVLESYESEKAEKLILLGDILYHGPRNELPKDYAPKQVTAMLNEVKKELLCVRGNCDAEVDQMVLEFPIMADYMTIFERGHMFLITHGHVIDEDHAPMMNPGDILIHGHTHLKIMEQHGDFVYINPGSTSLPKDDEEHSYMIYEDGVFTIKNFDGKELKSYVM